jgi:hypothetical protein
MCRYWAHTVVSQPFMKHVTSYLRLDTDTFLVEMPVDHFAILENENLGYLASVMCKESPVSTTGIWETFLRFARDEQIHPWGLAPLSRQGVDRFSDKDSGKCLFETRSTSYTPVIATWTTTTL